MFCLHFRYNACMNMQRILSIGKDSVANLTERVDKICEIPNSTPLALMLVLEYESNCPHDWSGTIGGMPSVGGLSKGS